MTPPKDKNKFSEWSSAETCGIFIPHIERWYSLNQRNVLGLLKDTDLFAELKTTIDDAAVEYFEQKGVNLFANNRFPDINWDKKTYGSFLEKLYRINCTENPNFPESPETGWLSLDRSFEQIDDIIRCTVVVAYADGPAFLANYIGEMAKQNGHTVTIKDHAKEKGYYAHHLYISLVTPISSTNAPGDYPDKSVPIEIQITTELQGVLRELTHRLYEQERLSGGLDQDWKNQFESGRFRAAYMAHSLRFIEAMIVDLRNTVEDEDKEQ